MSATTLLPTLDGRRWSIGPPPGELSLPLASHDGRLFTLEHRQWLKGAHPRTHQPVAGRTYVAGGVYRTQPVRRVVVTIAEIDVMGAPPVARVVDHRVADGPECSARSEALAGMLGAWRCRSVLVEGFGAIPPASASAGIAPAPSRERLTSALLSLAGQGSLVMYGDDGSSHWCEFWAQVVRARLHVTASGHRQFSMESGGSDDVFLTGLALVAYAASFVTGPLGAAEKISALPVV